MYMPELIRKKRDGGELTAEEISYIINGCVSGEVPDYQLSAFAMAVFFRGMNKCRDGRADSCNARFGRQSRSQRDKRRQGR